MDDTAGGRVPTHRPLIVRRLAALILVAVCLHSVATSVPGQEAGAAGKSVVEASAEPGAGGPSEYKLKAVFLYNFVRYTTWPKKALGKKDEPIEVLVVGKNHFAGQLEKVFKGKELHGRKVVIHYTASPPKRVDAQLVFTSGLSKKDESTLLSRCKGKPILLIGNHKGFAELGACANFYLDGKKLRFQVNREHTEEVGLTISSQLLKLADIVKSKRKEKAK